MQHALAATLDAAYRALEVATNLAFASAEDVLTAKQSVKEEEHAILPSYGDNIKALGSNEEQRKAALASRTEEVHMILAGYERDDRAARHELTIAQLRVDAARAQLRVIESASGLIPAGMR
jgi:hypothetical protein